MDSKEALAVLGLSWWLSPGLKGGGKLISGLSLQFFERRIVPCLDRRCCQSCVYPGRSIFVLKRRRWWSQAYLGRSVFASLWAREEALAASGFSPAAQLWPQMRHWMSWASPSSLALTLQKWSWQS